MTTDIASLEEMYIESCRRHDVLPNPSILAGFIKVEANKSRHENCTMEILLDQLKDIDFHPVLELCVAIEASDSEVVVDVHMSSSCMLEEDYVMALIRAFSQKLQVVHLHNSFGKEFFEELLETGLSCEVLNLRSFYLRKLNIVGEFMQLRTLILDHNRLVNGFEEDCFSCMPNLKSLSMCDTQVTNLWTTSAALSKLPSLEHLKFQSWTCCSDAGAVGSSSRDEDAESEIMEPNSLIGTDFKDLFEQINPNLTTGEALRSMFAINNAVQYRDTHSSSEDLSEDSEMDFSCCIHEREVAESPSIMAPELIGEVHMQEKVSIHKWLDQQEGGSPAPFHTRKLGNVGLKYISSKASPICSKKHYRMYMIASLPQLKVLDNLPIRKIDKDCAAETFSDNFEYLPYKRKKKESIINVLQTREMKSSHCSLKNVKSKSKHFYQRSLCAAKMGSSAWPLLRSLHISGLKLGDENRRFGPRQFEYHPSNPSLMVFGTLDGEVVVINHETGKILNYIPSLGPLNSILGLCWLKMYPCKLIAGSANGSLKLYDLKKSPRALTSAYGGSSSIAFDDFDQLTSVHVNSTDDQFLASGYSKDVALYDIGTGKRLQVFSNMHQEHINVVKFANHSKSLFATSSFDKDVKLWDLRQKPVQPCYTVTSTKGNVMVCFSPDDQYLLASAVDNEVRQLLAVDGRLHLNFDISPTGSSQNYTRSYYLNGKDYIISGSCDENLIRVCCAQTGRRLRDISLEGKGSDISMYVQSLRGDPFRDFNMSVLAAYTRPSSKSEIVKVNLLASSDSFKERCGAEFSGLSNSMGG